MPNMPIELSMIIQDYARPVTKLDWKKGAKHAEAFKNCEEFKDKYSIIRIHNIVIRSIPCPQRHHDSFHCHFELMWTHPFHGPPPCPRHHN